MGTAKVYIASDEVLITTREHLYLIYDPDSDSDSDPTTGSGVQIIRGGPTYAFGSPGYITNGGYGDIIIETGVAEASSADAFGAESVTDRNLTSLQTGAAATTLWTNMLTETQALGSYNGTSKITTMNVEYFAAGTNSAGVLRAVMDAVGYDIDSNLPLLGGSGPAISATEFTGLNAVMRIGADGVYDTTDIDLGWGPNVIYDDGGTDEYIVPSDRLTWIIEDTNAGTADEITIDGLDAGDATYVRRGNDLMILNGTAPIVVVKDYYAATARTAATINFDDGSVSTASLSPDAFVPQPVPSWIPDVQDPLDLSEDEASPIIVDIDNSGTIEATAFNAASTTTFFDLNNDGFKEQTAWVTGGDGLLAFDRDASGVIDDASELFGTSTVDGFAVLAELDTNGDLFITSADADFGDLLIWVDANDDAVSQGTELHSLSYHDIVNISLLGVTPSSSTVNGNAISHTTTVTLTSGATRSAGDVWFVHDPLNTFAASDIDIGALSLPNLRGYGLLPDLQMAMSENEDLYDLVQDFTLGWSFESFADGDGVLGDIEEILLNWAGVQDVDPDSRWRLDGNQITVDTRHLEFLEEFTGVGHMTFAGGDNPGTVAGQYVEQAWRAVLYNTQVHLLLQLGAEALFDNAIAYNPWTGEVDGDLDLSETGINSLIAMSTAGGVDTEAFWIAIARFLDYAKGLTNLSGTENTWMNDAIYDADPGLSWTNIKTAYTFVPTGDNETGTSGNDTLTGTDYDDTLTGVNGNDALSGGAGNDTLDGGYGADTLTGGEGQNILRGGYDNDTYVYAAGDDVIDDYGGTDTILLPVGVTPEDVTFSRVGAHGLIIDIAGQGYIQIDNQLDFNGLPYSIETLDFDDPGDGTIDLRTLQGLALYGTEADENLTGIQADHNGYYPVIDDGLYGLGGSDTLSGYKGDDILDGGAGNDSLSGGEGEDLYIASAGFDTIQEDSAGSDGDSILIPEEYGLDDIHLFRTPANNGHDLMVQVAGLGQMKLVYQFASSTDAKIEKIEFANGTDDDLILTSMGFETYGTSGADSISGIEYWASTDDIIFGLAGNDAIGGGAGEDQLYGGLGDDALQGGDDDDLYFWESGVDTISENSITSTNDRLILPEGVDPEDVTLITGTSGTLHVKHNGTTIVSISSQLTSNSWFPIEYIDFADETVWDMKLVPYESHGTASGDGLYATDSPNHSYDIMYGYAGSDTMYAYGGDDLMFGGDDGDTMYGGNDDDTMHGDAGNDTVRGDAGNDVLYGDAGNDSMQGNDGNDTIDGGAGDDTIEGNVGDDILIYGEGLDSISDTGDGADTLWITGSTTINDISFSSTGLNDTKITITASVDEVTVGYLRHAYAGFHIETIKFDDGFFTPQLPNYSSWLWGSTGNDVVAGNGSDNTLIGKAGNDTITGDSGSDYAHGGAGADTLEGGNGVDLLHGGADADTLNGQDGLDTLYGGTGADIFLWEAASAYNNVDLVKDFSTGQNDALDLSNLLSLYNPGTDVITDWVLMQDSGGNTSVSVDQDGTGGTYSMVQIGTLEGVTGLTDEAALVTAGTLIVV